MKYQLEITTTADVSPAANRERGFITPSLEYLPGGALRGSLAAHWIERFGPPGKKFEKFAADVAALRIGPGVAEGASARPLSVYACKYPTKSDCAEALDAAFGELPDPPYCPGCGRHLEPSKGGWEAGPASRMRTRTALTDDGTAKEGALYSRQYLTRNQHFVAMAYGDLGWLGAQPVALRVGGRRSVAGSVTLRAVEAPSAEPREGDRLVVRLCSPGVFLDAQARNQLVPQVGDFERALRGTDMASAVVSVAHAWTRPTVIGGWNSAAGLPKSTEVAAAIASTYVLACAGGFTAAGAGAISDRGLGVRRADGLGWVEVAPSAWRSAGGANKEATRTPPDSELVGIAGRAGESTALRRRIIGWLRDGYDKEHPPPGYAYDGLPNSAKNAADDALAVTGARRRALVIILTAQDHTLEDGRNG